MKQNYQTLTRMGKKESIKTYLFLIATFLLSCNIGAQSTYTFNSCGAVGRYGPTQTQVNTSYTNTNLMSLVTVSNGIQSFTVNGGLYRITAYGARGGNNSGNNGGLGAKMQGDFVINGTSVIKIIVGQQGEIMASPYDYNNTGGGGGSYVWINGQTTPLLVVGGGGGAGAGFDGSDATITTSGTVGSYGGGIAGTTGNGANPGGGGWFTPGQNFNSNVGTSCSAKCSGGTSGLTTGGACPTTAIVYEGCAGTSETGDGGFGGGSGANGYCSSSFGAGGGGGYSGGAGQSGANGYASGGGGAGSFNAGTNQINTASVSVGNGTVIIQELCSMNLTASGSNSIAPSICSGQSVTLTTNGVSNYAWSTGNTTSSVIVVSPNVTTVYTVSALTASNCTASRSMTVTVSGGLPVLTITNTPSAMCVGKSATLTAGGALAYSWAGGATTVTNGVGFFPTATTVYTVTGTNGCGQSTAQTTITIAPLTVTATTSSALVCQNSTVALTAASAVNGYTWAPNNVASNPFVTSPQANTIYTVTASDGTCVGTATVAVNTNPTPTVGVVASNSNVCDGSAITLTASGALSYTWSTVGSNNAVITVTPTGSTSYQVMGSNSFGCSSAGSQIVLTVAAPVVTISATKMTVCVGGSVNLTASGASSYAWTGGPNTASYLVNPTSQTTYSVVGTGTNGCPSQAYMITINTLSTNLSVTAASMSICEGGSTTLTATGADTYTWTGIPSSHGIAMVSPATSTVYNVSASTTITGLSCPSNTTIAITVNTNPTVSVSSTKTVICRNDAAVTLSGHGAVSYTWSANTGSASATASNVSVHPTVANLYVYSVIGTDANGCVNSGSVTVKVNTCNGINELAASSNNISIYPNPSNGEFTISSDKEINLKIVNELGQEVKNIYLSADNKFKGEVKNLANGVYFVVGQNANGKVNQKIIVTK